MSLLILRPLLTALIEYALAYHVFRKGKYMATSSALFLIFLGSYQLSEYLFLASGGDRFWLGVSLFCTTMLPPYGLFLIERLSGHKESTISTTALGASLVFGLFFLFVPSVIPNAQECNCFVKYNGANLTGNGAAFFSAWGAYYIGALTLSMALILWSIIKKQGDVKNLKLLLIGYTTFFPFSYIVALFTLSDLAAVASIMCSLAIFTAFIVSYISLNKDESDDEERVLGFIKKKHFTFLK